MNNHTGVQAALADLDLPNGLAGLWFDCVDKAVAAALNQESRAVDVSDDRRRVSRVVRTATRRTNPHHLAGFFVERHEAMCTASVLAPLERDAADDHEIAVDDGRHCASTVRGEQSEVFGEGTLP